MSHITLRCSECSTEHCADMTTLHCHQCGGVLDVAYTGRLDSFKASGIPSPLHDSGNTISLGEGNTPIVSTPNVGTRLGIRTLNAKLEMMNPTGSFKDRGTTVMMSVAKELGVEEVVEDSSGNAGASVAAYAARAGIRAHIFAPASAPAAKLDQIAVSGAVTHLIDGGRQAVTDAAIRFAAENRFVYASHNLSPYFIEGTKSFAYEVAAQFGYELPQHVVIPVGNGSLLIGAHRGFDELLRSGRISSVPSLHAVQARAVMPLVSEFTEGRTPPSEAESTIAGGIAVAKPPRLNQSLRALKETGGVAVSVADSEIVHLQRLIAAEEGIFIEPTSAAAFAGLDALISSGAIKPSESILVAATGFGLKDAIPQPQV